MKEDLSKNVVVVVDVGLVDLNETSFVVILALYQYLYCFIGLSNLSSAQSKSDFLVAFIAF